jgi:hypothetical protein
MTIEEEFYEWLEVLEREGLETAARSYYSVYRAIVVDNADPEERGRVQISCPSVGHDPLVAVPCWVDPAYGTTGDRMGWFDPPLVGAVVRVAFDNGDAACPKAYWGGWHTKADGLFPIPTEFGYVDKKPQKRGFRSRAGHLLLFNDAAGEEKVSLVWHKIADGDPALEDPDKVAADIAAGDKIATLDFGEEAVQLIDAEGNKVVLNTKEKSIILQCANGNLFTLSKDGICMMDNSSPASTMQLNGKGAITLIASKAITLNAPAIDLKTGGVTLGDGAVLGGVIFEQLLAWANSHTHAPMGTSPAAPPLLPNAKAQKVKLA